MDISHVSSTVVQQMEISDYMDANRYDNQIEFVEGIPFNPVLRPEFDMTPNDDREDLEIADWWNKPYIVAEDWREES